MTTAVRHGTVRLRARLYVWSVIFEPLFYFVLFEDSVFGITGNLSRLLQLATVILLGLRLLNPKAPRWVIPAWHRPLYRYFSLMFVLAIVAGLIGAMRGAYELPPATHSLIERTSLSAWLLSASVRPFFEYLTALYYFVYFVVLPRYLLVTPAEIDYALLWLKRTFVAVVAIGLADFAIAFALGSNSLILRNLTDGAKVETRFHGLAGEPRQAFVYLFFGLAMLHLYAFRHGGRLSRWWVAVVALAAILTQSATGVVAAAIFIMLLGAYSLSGLSAPRLVRLVAGLVVVVGLAYAAVVNSPRTMDYFRSASDLWYILETDQQLPYLMSKSNSDIYPMYDLTIKARAGDLLPVIIGSGFGSASAVANRYYRQSAELNNPHSQLARSLYETGLLGTFLYVTMFVAPIGAMTKSLSRPLRREFLIFGLLLVACSLADRSSAPFSYLGIAAATVRVARPAAVVS